MSQQADRLSDITKKQRQKIHLLINRAEVLYQRPNPFSQLKNPNKYISNPIAQQKNALQFLKQYQSNHSSQPDREYSLGRDKTFDYNSTLFKNIRQQSHIAEKPSELIHNQSMQSSASGNTQFNNDSLFKENHLLNKIDELVMGKKKEKQKGQGIRKVYDSYLEKKSMSNSSSSISGSNLFMGASSTSYKFDGAHQAAKSNLAQMLKNLQQQKEKPIPHKQKYSNRNEKTPKKGVEEPKGNKNLPPKVPSSSSNTNVSTNTIERQKKKLQQTMKQIKKEHQSVEYNDRSSLLLEISDDSEQEERDLPEKSQQLQLNKAQNEKISALKSQKEKLIIQLKDIEAQLEKLEREEEQEDE